MRRTLTASAFGGSGTLLALALACNPSSSETETDISLTSSSDGSTTFECEVGSLNCACTGGGACDPGLTCVADICVDLGGTTSGTTSTSTSTTTDTTSGDATTEEPTTSGTTEDPSEGRECDPDMALLNPSCPEDAPYCSQVGVCGDCSVLVACGAVDPATPVCDASGACVQCNAVEDGACAGATPICDLTTKSCVGCSRHSECPDSACDIASGACLPTDRVLEILPDVPEGGKCTDKVDGGKPYCDFEQVVGHFAKHGLGGGWTVRLLKGPMTHGALAIQGNDQPATIALLAYEDNGTQPDILDTLPTVRVLAGAGKLTTYLDNLDVVNTANTLDYANVECQSATLYVTRSRIRGGAGAGLRSNMCNVVVRDSTIAKNQSEGIEALGGTLVLRNAMITENGGHATYGGGGVSLSNIPSVDIAYTTIVNNTNTGGKAESIHCFSSSGTARNSIFAEKSGGDSLSVQCKSLKLFHSIVDGGDFDAVMMNVVKAPAETLALLQAEATTGIYRWKAAAKDKPARWQSGDPRYDFEGHARAAVVGAEDYAGADVFPE